jgi:hypothetical protein
MRMELGVFEATQARIPRRYRSAHPPIRFSNSCPMRPQVERACWSSRDQANPNLFSCTVQEDSPSLIARKHLTFVSFMAQKVSSDCRSASGVHRNHYQRHWAASAK